MKLFLDTANIEEIKRVNDMGIICGVTTNPSLIAKEGRDFNEVIKEITEASMIDAVDYSYYRKYGEIKINKEKFYESFFRRFAETTSLNTTYTVSFYGVYEAPPKASVEIKSKSNTFTVLGDATTVDMVERIDSILEGNVIDE